MGFKAVFIPTDGWKLKPFVYWSENLSSEAILNEALELDVKYGNNGDTKAIGPEKVWNPKKYNGVYIEGVKVIGEDYGYFTADVIYKNGLTQHTLVEHPEIVGDKIYNIGLELDWGEIESGAPPMPDDILSITIAPAIV